MSTQADKRFGWWQRITSRDERLKMPDVPVHTMGMTSGLRTTAQPSVVEGVDQTLLGVLVGILAWSVVMVYSASIAMGDSPRMTGVHNEFFLIRHVVSIAVAFVAAVAVFQVPMEVWRKNAIWVLLGTLVLLVAVLIPGLGISVNGSRRWLPLGVMRFQPSELAKLAAVIYAADYMVRRMDVREKFMRAVTPIGAAVGFIGLLLLAEPDLGAFVVVASTAVGILFLGGVNIRGFALMLLVLLSAFVLMIWLEPYRRARFFAYLNPWHESYRLNEGYQLTHSLISFGRGEIFGVGLGGSVEKLHWLPEPHTDFILAVIGEELGLVGVLLLIAVYFWLVRRIMVIGRRAVALDRIFAGLVAQGIGLWIGIQSMINIGVTLGALPTKGLTLPLMSFGGSAMLLSLMAIAIVLRVDYENRSLMRGERI
ncbi:putative lipid II flippase FtsW [Allofranklinella schreckenbergeri]|uniref:Probable peptidoglycan glycosyltransferase FtsW n=1 Tax=Allofranklinella schreckenbergeri TaxID=1076744 RepID=A0A3M6QHU0_9BURK|nr:putative lipid II flippase FtsW [Allofranklinella schreckenbergeri]RMX02029.1 putative lipid II flippase FtsW [Allofranklinella schreckenbergeri]RRD44703.1 putative lipid II flippase FtsW [Comamonadaceae bacterium OH3737_COT-264]